MTKPQEIQWSPAAEQQLQASMDQQRRTLQAAGADPAEVFADLKAHIEVSVAENGRSVVTVDDVLKVTGPTSVPNTTDFSKATDMDSLNQSADLPGKRKHFGVFSFIAVVFLGILLPAATLIIELLSGISAQIFYNPIPTWFHAVLIALVPVLNLVVLILIRKASTEGAPLPRCTGIFCGLGGGICLYYALLYLPITPFAIIGIFFGIGLLPLSPLLGYVAYFILRRGVRIASRNAGRRALGTWPGLLLALLLIILADGRTYVTYAGFSIATSPDTEKAATGIELLRTLGSRKILLDLCYSDTAFPWTGFHPALRRNMSWRAQETNRKIYYQVTGVPFNAEKHPAPSWSRGGWPVQVWDEGLGGDTVANRVPGLSLFSSRMDIALDADASLAYTEWTVEFKNDSLSQQEARMQMQLPPGGVVSRLSLWIDGEPQEAAFGGRSQTKSAYKKVVQRRRDPVLATTSGPDRVLVQCFPVPPRGGMMKIRVGITSPMQMVARENTQLLLPNLIERNFDVTKDFKHNVWAEGICLSLEPSVPMQAEDIGPARQAIRGDISHTDLSQGIFLTAARDANVTTTWCEDLRSKPSRIIGAGLVEKKTAPPAHLVVVLDCSVSLKEYQEELAGLFESLSFSQPVSLILAEDQSRTAIAGTREGDHLAQVIRALHFKGGRDSIPALTEAYSQAGKADAVLWIHGPQPVEIEPVSSLLQLLERKRSARIYSLQLVAGPNLGLKKVYPTGRIQLLSKLADVNALLAKQTELVWERTVVPTPPPESQQARPTSDHLVRLFVLDQVRQLADAGGKEQEKEAMRQAVRHQLVTRVSGAVVLETQQQYKEAGLDPADKDDVPTVPEPGTWIVMLLGTALLASRRKRPMTVTHISRQ